MPKSRSIIAIIRDGQNDNDKLFNTPKPLSAQIDAIPAAKIGNDNRRISVSKIINKKLVIHLKNVFSVLL